MPPSDERRARRVKAADKAEADGGGLAVAILSAFAIFAYLLIAPTTLMDGDTGWHLATGRWIAAHGAVPTADPFSYTAAGRPWVAHEWLSELVMYAAWRAGGWSGLIVLVGAALAALFAIVAAHLRRWMSGRATLLAMALLAIGLHPSILARPHVFALPLLAAWLGTLLRAREAGRAPPPPLAALMLVWANAHGSFVFGLALSAVFALEALIAAAPADRRAVVLGWGAFGLLAGGAALCTPAGLHGLLYPFYVNGLALLPYLDEWRPADFAGLSGFELVLLAGLFFTLVKRTAVPPVRLLLLLGVLHLALEHARQGSVLIVVGLLVLAEPLGRGWAGRTASRATTLLREERALLGMVLALATGLAGYRIAVPIIRADAATVPATAIDRLPPALRTRRVFNEYSFGGSLVLAGIRPFIDGRSDMYGDAFSIDYFRIAKGDLARFRAADARWRFGWTMLPPANPLVPALDADPHWRRIYADEVAVVHIRR